MLPFQIWDYSTVMWESCIYLVFLIYPSWPESLTGRAGTVIFPIERYIRATRVFWECCIGDKTHRSAIGLVWIQHHKIAEGYSGDFLSR